MASTGLFAFFGVVFGAVVALYIPSFFSTNVVFPSHRTTFTATPSTSTDFQEVIDRMNSAVEKCLTGRKSDTEIISILTSNVDTLKEIIHTLVADLGNVNTSLYSMRDEVQSNYTILNENVLMKNFIVESQVTELSNVFVTKEWLFLLVLVGLIEVVLILVNLVMWQTQIRQKLLRSIGGPHMTD